jgi:hypothetical protein
MDSNEFLAWVWLACMSLAIVGLFGASAYLLVTAFLS